MADNFRDFNIRLQTSMNEASFSFFNVGRTEEKTLVKTIIFSVEVDIFHSLFKMLFNKSRVDIFFQP